MRCSETWGTLHVQMSHRFRWFIAHPHSLVRATSGRFLLAKTTFRVGLANESQWLQPILVLTVR